MIKHFKLSNTCMQMVDLPNGLIDVSSMTQDYDRPSGNVHIYKLDAVRSHSVHDQPVLCENNTFGHKLRKRMFVLFLFSIWNYLHAWLVNERPCYPNFYKTYYKWNILVDLHALHVHVVAFRLRLHNNFGSRHICILAYRFRLNRISINRWKEREKKTS